MLHWNICNYIFKCCCVIVTCTIVGKWFYMYHLDEDMSFVEYRSYYDTEEDVYPVMSMCFAQSFNDNIFQKYDLNVSTSAYMSYLNGDYSHINLTTIDYDNVSTNISDFLIG